MPKQASKIASALAYVPGYLEYQQRYQPFIGAQVAVRVDGELLLNHAVGMADVGGAVPLTTDHLFRVASHSKTFTAVACMQLVEQGKLRLDDQARDHVPDLGKSSMGTVTVRELLGHGSGMIRDGLDSTFWSLDRTFPDRKELLKVIKSNGKILEPNEHFKYSNIGYSLLGLIVEGASGQPYREYVSEHIVGKLGLKDTGPDIDFDRIEDYAKGYSSRAHGHDRREIEHIDTFAESAATGFYSTAAELTDYFHAHLDGDDRLMTDGSKRRMRQEQWRVTEDSAYGLGLSISRINGRTYYGHSGGYPGHITISHVDLERRLTLSVLTNMNDGPAGSLATAMLHLIDLALTDEAKTGRSKRKALARFEGRFATLWGVFDVANIGGRLYLLAPALPNPAAEAIELEVVSDDELKVVGDKGFGGYGERMTYTFRKDGSVKQLRGASGAKLVPIEDFTLPERITRPS